jgi:predicted membrane-bound mannosyltransferase
MVVVIKVRHSRYVRSDLVMVAMMVMMAGMATTMFDDHDDDT